MATAKTLAERVASEAAERAADGPTVVTYVRLRESTRDKLDELAEKRNLDLSELIRAILEQSVEA